VVVGVDDWSGEPSRPPEPVRGSVAVYGRHVLYRAVALVDQIVRAGGRVCLPDDIAPLVEAAYGVAALGPGAWQPAMDEAHTEATQIRERKRQAARAFRLGAPQSPGVPILGWLHGSVGEADDTAAGRAQVRDSDDSIEALLLRRSPDGQLRVPDGKHAHAGELVPMAQTPGPALARAIAGCSIRLPGVVSAGRRGEALIASLERQGWIPEWQRSPILAGQLVLPIDDVPGERFAGWIFSYNDRTGLEAHDGD